VPRIGRDPRPASTRTRLSYAGGRSPSGPAPGSRRRKKCARMAYPRFLGPRRGRGEPAVGSGPLRRRLGQATRSTVTTHQKEFSCASSGRPLALPIAPRHRGVNRLMRPLAAVGCVRASRACPAAVAARSPGRHHARRGLRHANEPRFSFGTGKLAELAAGFASAILLAPIAGQSFARLLAPSPSTTSRRRSRQSGFASTSHLRRAGRQAGRRLAAVRNRDRRARDTAWPDLSRERAGTGLTVAGALAVDRSPAARRGQATAGGERSRKAGPIGRSPPCRPARPCP
jgi:hypothetical protein